MTQWEQLMQYAVECYDTKPDMPFASHPYAFALRHGDTKKWYALLMRVDGSRIGRPEHTAVDICNIKCDPLLLGSLYNGTNRLPAYHMHKAHWLTLVLDGTLPWEEIRSFLDMSYTLTDKKRKAAFHK